MWTQPSCENDCFFCVNDITGFNTKNKNKIVYVPVASVTSPIPIVPNKCVDNDTSGDFEKMEINEKFAEESESESESHDDDDCNDSDVDYVPCKKKPKVPSLITQSELNNVIRNLGLPKDGAEYLASFLKSKNVMEPGAKASVYRNRDSEFRKYFSKCNDSSLVFCNNIEGLMNELKKNCYKDEDWRLFIDSSKVSIKGVLLHNTNVYAPVPIAHSTIMQEKYESMQVLLEKIDYKSHEWQICGDLKIITMLLGQQSGFTKYPCYLCLWDSRNRKDHYKDIQWPSRSSFEPGSKNIINESLVNPSKILIPPLHIKLGLMKQFVKALDKTGQCFLYLQTKFPKISEGKIKAGVFDGPQIRTLFKDPILINKMDDLEKSAWLSFKDVAQNFLGNRKSPEYKSIVAKMVRDYERLGCLMNLKLHFLHSHLDRFPDNLGDFSEEQGERFHQDLKVMETRYQGRWDVNMMSDFCWMLKRDTPTDDKNHKKRPLHRSFEDKRTRYSSKKENE